MMIALQSVISLALAIWLVFFLFNYYRVDRLRQQLFELRDRLFDEAALGRIGFSSECYTYTRTVMNGMIRFAHRLSLSRVAIGLLTVSAEQHTWVAAKHDAVMSAASPEDRALCARYLAEANKLLVRHLGRSPFMFVLLIPMIAGVLALVGISLTTVVAGKARRLLSRLDDAAFREGARGSQFMLSR
jgi:hypothetical protein